MKPSSLHDSFHLVPNLCVGVPVATLCVGISKSRGAAKRAFPRRAWERATLCFSLAMVVLTAVPPGARAENDMVRLYVRPAAAPTPALKYALLPDDSDLNPGNPAQAYFRCFMEQSRFFYSEEAVAERERFQTLPLTELPLEKLRGYGGNALRQADWGARLNALDWQDESGGLDARTAELGQLQVLARALRVRLRAEVAERRYPDAIVSAQTMLALARHLGEHPSEVGGLMGMSVAHLALVTVRELVQQPGCPNLYWALTDLPGPVVDLRRGVQGRRAALASDLASLRGDAAMTDAELESWVSRLSGSINFAREQAGRPPRNVRGQFRALAGNSEYVRTARRRLTEAGVARDILSALPPAQVIALDAKRQFEIAQDERIKLLSIPLWQTAPAGIHADEDGQGLLDVLLPNIGRLRQAQAALEQEVAVLRHIEALRLHAAGVAGRLPAKLTDLSVPLPNDPANGKPLVYEASGTTAHLHAALLPGVSRYQQGPVDFELIFLKR